MSDVDLPLQRIKALINTASQKTDKSVSALADLFRMALEQPQPHLQCILSFFYLQLDVARIPSSTSLDSPLSLVHVAYFLDLIPKLWTYQRHSSHWEEIMHTWTRLWPTHLWKWIQYLALYIEDKNNDIYSRLSILNTVVTSLFSLTLDNLSSISVSSHTGIATMLARMWYLEAKDPDFDPWKPKVRLRNGIIPLTLGLYLQALETADNIDWLQAVITPMGGSVATVASSALKNLRRAISRKPVDHIVLKRTVELLTGLMTAHLPIAHALLSQNAPRIVTHALAILPFTLSRDSDYLVEVMHSCLSYLDICTCLTNGMDWVAQILEANILPTLLKLGPWLNKVDSDSHPSLILLRHILPIYLVYASILKSVERSLKKVATLDLEAHVPKVGPFWNVWSIFKSLVEGRTKLKAEVIQNWKVPVHLQMCSNPKCANIDSTNSFMICSACSEHRYCSKACQKDDWVFGGHKKFCTDMVAWRQAGKSFPLSSRDVRFSNIIISNDVKKHLNDMSDGVHHITRGVMQVLQIQYSTFPPAANVPPPSRIIDDNINEEWNSIVSSATKMSSSFVTTVITRIYLPMGETSRVVMNLTVLEYDTAVHALGSSKCIGAFSKLMRDMGVKGFDESPQETYEDEDAERMSIMIQTMALPFFK